MKTRNLPKTFTILILVIVLFLSAINNSILAVTNLLNNGNFENNFTGWSNTSGVAISSTIFHEGSKAARFTNGNNITQTISGTVGKTYKITFWIRINSGTSCTGTCWGGFRPRIDNWSGLTDPVYTTNSNIGVIDYLTPSSRTVDTWYKETFSFKVNSATSGQLSIGAFAGSSWVWDVVVDDVQFFEVPAVNTNPVISNQANPTTSSTIPASINFTSTGDDSDGVIAWYFWDFGDGGKSNNFNPSHTYISNGIYTVRLTVYDDSGGSNSTTTTVTINDPAYPVLAISSPADQFSTSSSSINFSGATTPGSSGTISTVKWFTDRDQSGTATGTTTWNFSLDLTGRGGRNRVTVIATDSNGKTSRQDIIVFYNPSSTVSIVNGASGVTQNSSSIEKWDKFEASFSIQNSRSNNFYFPYETDLPAGMAYISGITVNATFTSPTGKQYVQPGFYIQPYAKNNINKNVIPNGNAGWMIRFSPQETGTWTYTLTVTDSSGTNTASNNSLLTFNVINPTNSNNHGFLKPSPNDSRYFEFSDGTPFIGVGPGAYISDPFSTDLDIQKVQQGASDVTKTANFTRTWMSGQVAGSSWAPWAGNISYDGNIPGTALTTEEAYGDGIYSLKLDTDQQCAFYGFVGLDASLKPNTNYKVMARVKTVGVTTSGTGGFTFRPGTSWPDTCNKFAGQAAVTPFVKGNSEWQETTGTWNSGSNKKLDVALITLENVTAGTAYVDEISMREDLGSGNYGPEIMTRSKFNVQNSFSQENAYNWDYGLTKYEQYGYYQKTVITEKQDYAFNHISPYGFGWSSGNQISNTFINSASLKYQQYYWRYLIARYGYSRAIQSWEYANEEGPSTFTMANELQKYMNANDPNKHMAITSFWCCVEQPTGTFYWKNNNLMRYGDSHSYTGTGGTSWIGDTDPITGGSMVTDSALYVTGHSLDAQSRNVSGSKPFIMGEAGIVNGATTVGQNDNDTNGVWLHQFLWSQINPGRINYFLYWWNNNWFQWNDTLSNSVWDPGSETVTKNLYPLFVNYRKFMEGTSGDSFNKRIPINNGKYADIGLTLPANVRGWGQKDTTNGGAYMWLYDSGYTYTTPSGGSALANKTISFSGLAANTYTAEIWDTWTGTVTSQDVTPSGGTISITFPGNFTAKDAAVKIYPKNVGYSASVPTGVRGDFNNSGSTNATDLSIFLTKLGSTDPADLFNYRLRTLPSSNSDYINASDLSILLFLL